MTTPTPEALATAERVVTLWCRTYSITFAPDANLAAHFRRDITRALDAYAQERERAAWEAALRLLADHEDHNGTGLHGRTDGRGSDCIGELEQAFRACAHLGPHTITTEETP